jgi:hypothetical protein
MDSNVIVDGDMLLNESEILLKTKVKNELKN